MLDINKMHVFTRYQNSNMPRFRRKNVRGK